MTTKGIYIGEAIKFGWQTMKKNLSFFIILLSISILLICLPGIISNFLLKDAVILNLIIQIVGVILHMVISMGLIGISLKFCDNQKGKLKDIFAYFPLFFKYLFSTILYALIIICGMILLIFPAFIWGIRFCFYPYFIVEKKMGPIKALKASSALTNGVKWDLLGFFFVSSLITFIGVFCIFIGLFATIPTVMIATAIVYKKLLEQMEIKELSDPF